MLPKLFGFPLYRGPGGASDWRVRWVPLLVWVCLLNAVLFAVILYFQPADEPIPVSWQTNQTRTVDNV